MREFSLSVWVITLTISGLALAVGPFRGVSGKSLNVGVDDCSSTKLLDQAITESGVNFLDQTPLHTWNCQCKNGRGECEGGSKESRRLLNGCQKDDAITCYSNMESKNPAVCVSKARTAKVQKTYADAGTVTENRARFDALYVVRQSAGGYSADKFWKMDSAGCEPERVYNRNAIDSQEDCVKVFRNYVNGGSVYPDSDRSAGRFCGRTETSLSTHISGVKRLSDCLSAYPHLDETLRKEIFEPGGAHSHAQKDEPAPPAPDVHADEPKAPNIR